MEKDVSSKEIQEIVHELVLFTDETNHNIKMGEQYWHFIAEMYLTSPIYREATDKKYGNGAANFIGLALKAYLQKL